MTPSDMFRLGVELACMCMMGWARGGVVSGIYEQTSGRIGEGAEDKVFKYSFDLEVGKARRAVVQVTS